MVTTLTLKECAQIVDFRPERDSVRLPGNWDFSTPVLDLPICIDESVTGLASIVDGRKRFLHLVSLAIAGKISWNLQISVNLLDFRKILPHGGDQESLEFHKEDTASASGHGLLNPDYIANFLRTHANRDYEIERYTFVEIVRRIYRHLLNSMRSTHKDSFELVELVRMLSLFMAQKDIAKIMKRSEGWVSDAVAVGKLPLKYLAELENRMISFSAASVLAHAKSETEQKLLYELSKKLDVRSLTAALRYLIARPGFAEKKNALEKLARVFSRKVLDVGGRAKLQLQVGVERSIRKLFKMRGNQTEIPHQSLVFRLKITYDGENAEEIARMSLEKVENLRKSVLVPLQSAL